MHLRWVCGTFCGGASVCMIGDMFGCLVMGLPTFACAHCFSPRLDKFNDTATEVIDATPMLVEAVVEVCAFGCASCLYGRAHFWRPIFVCL